MPEKTKGGQQALTSETGTQLPGQGPALACYHFNLRHLRCKKSCPSAVREPGFSIRFVFWRSKSRCSLHLKPQDFQGPASGQRDQVRERKTHASPSAASGAALEHSHILTVPPPLGIYPTIASSYRSTSLGRKDRCAHTYTRKSTVVLFTPGK